MYADGGDYYFVPVGPFDTSSTGFGAIVSVSELDANTVFGTDSDDTLLGDIADDTILGGEGEDTLDGGAGDDMLHGGTGHDVLRGGAGDDTLIAGEDGAPGSATVAPILALNFEDGGSSTASDDSGNGHDAVYQNGAAAGATGWDGSGTGVVLDGSNDYVEVPDSSDFDLTEGTISIRFNADELGGYLVSRDSSGYDGGGHVGIWINSDGSVDVRMQDTGQSYSFGSGSGLVSTGQWHHVALTFGLRRAF